MTTALKNAIVIPILSSEPVMRDLCPPFSMWNLWNVLSNRTDSIVNSVWKIIYYV